MEPFPILLRHIVLANGVLKGKIEVEGPLHVSLAVLRTCEIIAAPHLLHLQKGLDQFIVEKADDLYKET